MISSEARKAFKIFRDPFQHGVQGTGDIYMSEEHRYMFYAMREVIRRCQVTELTEPINDAGSAFKGVAWGDEIPPCIPGGET
jgi:hypothetical protein